MFFIFTSQFNGITIELRGRAFKPGTSDKKYSVWFKRAYARVTLLPGLSIKLSHLTF